MAVTRQEKTMVDASGGNDAGVLWVGTTFVTVVGVIVVCAVA
jgi:hypothetical protein